MEKNENWVEEYKKVINQQKPSKKLLEQTLKMMKQQKNCNRRNKFETKR